jgi:hypothetical protein
MDPPLPIAGEGRNAPLPRPVVKPIAAPFEIPLTDESVIWLTQKIRKNFSHTFGTPVSFACSMREEAPRLFAPYTGESRAPAGILAPRAREWRVMA